MARQLAGVVMGARRINAFQETLGDLGVKVTGHGLMIGLHLPKPCAELVGKARDQEKLLLNVTADSVIRLLPALVITPKEADEIIERVSRLIRKFLS